LSRVFLDGVNLDDPALGHFKSLKSMQLHDVKINGVDLADPSLEPLRERLKAALPGTRTRIVSRSNHSHPVEWGNPPEQGN
jgi:hypothetical protein